MSAMSIYTIAIALAVTYYILTALPTRYKPGLRRLPGPWLASFSHLDRFYTVAKGGRMHYDLHLHRKYKSTFVRVGPNHVSFSDASLIPQIYSINSKFHKSDFYSLFDIIIPASPASPPTLAPTIFSVRDEERHRGIKRPIANAYSMSSLKELEPMNDACSEIFLRKLDDVVERRGGVLDLGKWVHWYAFDVITSITFSNRLGFMEEERDIDGIIAAIEGRLVYNSVIGQVPWLHKHLFLNPTVARVLNAIPAVARMNKSRFIVAFAAKQLARYQTDGKATLGELQDMLDRFKRFKDGEQVMSDAQLLGHATSNIFAGSDTTAAALRALFYHLARTPAAQRRLLAELDAADAAGALSDPVTFAEAQQLPYFQAVVKEALRMHPTVGMLLERVVPAGGAAFTPTMTDGDSDSGSGGRSGSEQVHLPAGTIIGMNPWVAARDAAVYAPDPCAFRPERWLEAAPSEGEGEGGEGGESSESKGKEGKEAHEARLKLMERNFLAFGAGARTCLGKNISLLEMSKVVPQVLRRYEFEFAGEGEGEASPEQKKGRGWELHCYWFVRQTGLVCRVKRRGRGKGEREGG